MFEKKLFLSSLGPHFDTKMMLNVVFAPPASQNLRPCVTELDPTGRPGGGRGAEGLLFNILGRLLGSPSVANLHFYDNYKNDVFSCNRAFRLHESTIPRPEGRQGDPESDPEAIRSCQRREKIGK